MKTKRFRNWNFPAIGAAVIALVLAGLLGWSETQRQRQQETNAQCVHAVGSIGRFLDAVMAATPGDST